MNPLTFIPFMLIVGAALWFVIKVTKRASTEKALRGYREFNLLARGLIIVGFMGFFVMHATLIPSSLEWPVGRATGIFTTEDGLHIVPHTGIGRIQIYDADWIFIRGWYVNAGEGEFKIISVDSGRIEIVAATKNGDHYLFDLKGEILSQGKYAPKAYSSFPDRGTAFDVPTSPWLLLLSHPFGPWCLVLLGFIVLGASSKLEEKEKKLASVIQDPDQETQL